MLNWFKSETVDKYQRQEVGEEPSPYLESVLSVMEDCYKNITGFSNVKIQYKLKTEEFYFWADDSNGRRLCLPLSQMSDGYRSTIGLVADIAYRTAVLNPQFGADAPRETAGVALIDEVDLHLHPRWQKRVLNDLQRCFPKLQFIVGTHAPVVISSVRSENLIVLDDPSASV